MENIKEYFKQEKENLRAGGQSLLRDRGIVPSLTIIDATDQDPANQIYVKKKTEDFKDVGWETEVLRPTSAEDLRWKIATTSTPMIVQMPISKIFQPQAGGLEISPALDCDGLGPSAIVMPATVRGIIDYLDDNDFQYAGRTAVVLGRSQIVGRPMAKALIDRDMTVTLCHSKTYMGDLLYAVKEADLVVCATGVEGLLSRKDCPWAVVIDVGITRGQDGKLHGDFKEDDFERKIGAWSTPVPGGVGLLTRLGLMKNCLELCSAV